MNDAFIRTILLAGLGIAGALSAVVISEEDLEASKPQLEVSQNGNDLDIHWDAQPEVYYFVEGTENFETWVTGKLLKDIDDDGALSVHPAIESEKKFYRLSLLGDPGDERLRADDDGDKIINLLEADAGWDHLTPSDPADSDNDGIPDYWEEFHFNTTEHDASYVAVEGGLTLAEAYAHATDPKKVDSDGDGWTDAQEIAWGWDPNYDQSRDDPKYGPDGDFDGDGINNQTEINNGTDHTDATDAPPFPPSYAVIDLGPVTDLIADTPYRVASNGTVLFKGSANKQARIWSFSSGMQTLVSPDDPDNSIVSFDVIDMNDSGSILGSVEETYTSTTITTPAQGSSTTVIQTHSTEFPVIWAESSGAYQVSIPNWVVPVPADDYTITDCNTPAETYQTTTESYLKETLPTALHDDGRMVFFTEKVITYQSSVKYSYLAPCDPAVTEEDFSINYPFNVIGYADANGQSIDPILNPLKFSGADGTLITETFTTYRVFEDYFSGLGDLEYYTEPVFEKEYQLLASASDYVAVSARLIDPPLSPLSYTLYDYSGVSIYNSAQPIIEVNNSGIVVLADGTHVDTSTSQSTTLPADTSAPTEINTHPDGLHTIITHGSEEIWIRKSELNPTTNAIEPASEFGFTWYSMKDLVSAGNDLEAPLWSDFWLTGVANNGMLCGTALKAEGENLVERAVLLLKMDLATDLNNDGEIDDADRTLRNNAAASGASDEAIALGREYMFDGDSIDNGLWDKDSGSGQSQDDDDLEEILVEIGDLSTGYVWFEHPHIANMGFFPSKQRITAEQISFPLDLSADASVFDAPIYAAAFFNPTDTNKQYQGELKLMFSTSSDKSNPIEFASIDLSVVKEYGAEDYFNAARDYIYENNTRTYVDVKTYPGSTYHIVVFPEDLSSMKPYSAYDYSNDKIISKNVNEVALAHTDASVIINSNWQSEPNLINRMYTKCIGEFVLNTNLVSPPTDLKLTTQNPQWAYVGYDSDDGKYSFLEGRQVGSYSGTPPTEHGIGGLRLDYASGSFNGINASPGGLIGVFEEPELPENDRLVFVMMNPYVGLAPPGASHTKAAIDARNSGIPISSNEPRKLFLLDGGGSLALAHQDPSDTMVFPVRAPRHSFTVPVTRVNSYFIFNINRPR